MTWVYVLYSKNYNRFYVGMTDHLEDRLALHNKGVIKSTMSFRPWQLVMKEKFDSKSEARVREKYLKSAAGRRWRKLHLRSKMGD